jgi:hypothetical protein
MKKPIADNNNPNGVNMFKLYLSYNIPHRCKNCQS